MTDFNPVPRIVSIDEGYCENIPCVMDVRNRWNGFAIPYFDRAAVDLIIHDVMQFADENTAAWDGDVVVLTDNVGTPDEWVERVEPTVIDGVQRWCIGGGSWVWFDFDEDNCTSDADHGCNDDDCPWAACQWCNGSGCQSCGDTGHDLTNDGLPHVPTEEV
jgi:hypothetical protein